jgi:Helix-turn-helix domain
MDIDLITKQDLQSFRIELLQELKQLLSTAIPHKQKQWLKSVEVRKLLKISPGTLQNLRINGTLRFTKIGGLIYYSYEDIEKLLESGFSLSPSLSRMAGERAGVRSNLPSPLEKGRG